MFLGNGAKNKKGANNVFLYAAKYAFMWGLVK
jgi:hypothetical protein